MFIILDYCALNLMLSFLSSSQVKKSTLNPNAKEFNPIKPQMPMVRTLWAQRFNGFKKIMLSGEFIVTSCVFVNIIEKKKINRSLAATYLPDFWPTDKTQHCAHSSSANSSESSCPAAPGWTGTSLQHPLPLLCITDPRCAGTGTRKRCDN